MSTTFLLIRHGQPDWSWAVTHECFGTGASYIPLTPDGISQIECTALSSELLGSSFIVASPYTRTMQTAQILSRRLNLDVTVDWDFHEWLYDLDFRGDKPKPGERYSFEDLCFRWEHYANNMEKLPDDNCETMDMVRARVIKALQRYMGPDKVIVACHEGVIRSVTNLSSVQFGQIVPLVLEGDYEL